MCLNVFEAMFRYDTKNAKTEAHSAELPNPVEMPDVEAAAFKVMLSFIYAADLSKLDGKNAMAVLYAAKKYGVNGLIGFRPSMFAITFVKMPSNYSSLRNFCKLALRWADEKCRQNAIECSAENRRDALARHCSKFVFQRILPKASFLLAF
ncbi:hypothetical protein niasHS_008921 [Heterodera schachtii]|uniref:BTB domain-containing protein n=1 Tax=Heterodera schachtii TaxID=97005 RepID=A0ABD2J746_HETSC